ncbi:MAG: aspartate aminotransferase family protein [Elusimicrobia bacterium]|nr:aspartate aminotransferase family protein [Elusimicrobiota bacterium]
METVAAYSKHVNPEFAKLLGVFGYGRLFASATDVWLYDAEGRKYLDCLAGFGSCNVGHNHPRLVGRLKAFLEESAFHLNHLGPAAHAAAVAERLALLLPRPLEITLFSSSGSEAVDAAMKVARAATGRAGFVYCRDSFHGTSLGPLSIMGGARLRAPFEPLLNDCAEVPFGDASALEAALKAAPRAAFLVEPVQAEGGVCLPPSGYLRRAKELCRRHGALFILDEVQTGLGRTGSDFAMTEEDVVPDAVVLAKSLGGGLAPIGATVVSREVHDAAYGSMDRFDLHSSTFAGNAFSCAAALETLEILKDEELSVRARDQGKRLVRALEQGLNGHPLVRAVRGRGLLVAVELGAAEPAFWDQLVPGLTDRVAREVFGQWAAVRLLEKGVVAQPASQRWNVLRLEPPLTIAAPEIDRAAAAVVEVLSEYRGAAGVLKDAGLRIGRQLLNGGRFG